MSDSIQQWSFTFPFDILVYCIYIKFICDIKDIKFKYIYQLITIVNCVLIVSNINRIVFLLLYYSSATPKDPKDLWPFMVHGLNVNWLLTLVSTLFSSIFSIYCYWFRWVPTNKAFDHHRFSDGGGGGGYELPPPKKSTKSNMMKYCLTN